MGTDCPVCVNSTCEKKSSCLVNYYVAVEGKVSSCVLSGGQGKNSECSFIHSGNCFLGGDALDQLLSSSFIGSDVAKCWLY